MTQNRPSGQVCITGTGLFTPEQIITNDELVASYNAYATRYNETHAAEIEAGECEALALSNSDFIVKASGIRNRHVLDKSGVLDPERMCPRIPERPDDQMSVQCEMAVAAIRGALEQAGRTGQEVDLVIVACANLQRAYPAIAIEVQQAIGAKGYAFDMNVACSSSTFGISAARDALQSGSASCAVVVSPEICSGHLAWEDRDCHFIFGDVATALVLEREEDAISTERWDIVATRLITQFSNNIRNNAGFLNRCDEQGIGKRDKLFRQNGRRVFKDVVPMVAELISTQLAAQDLPVSGVSRMWLHQANLGMNQLIAKKVLGEEVTDVTFAPVILDEYGNTSSAGSIIAFHKHRADLASGSTGVICSFGAGYSAGCLIVRKR